MSNTSDGAVASPKNDQAFLRLVFFNVGHGSCTLVSLPPIEEGGPRRYGVVDSCELGAASVEYYLRHPPFPDERLPSGESLALEFVAITHFDRDHFMGMARLLGASGAESDASLHFGIPLHFIGPLSRPKTVAEERFKNEPAVFRELYDIWEFAYRKPFAARRPGRAPSFDIFLLGLEYEWLSGVELKALAPVAGKLTNSELVAFGSNPVSGALWLRLVDCPNVPNVIFGGDVESPDWHRIRRHFEPDAVEKITSSIVLAPHHGGDGNPPAIWECFSRLRPVRDNENRKKRTRAIISCSRGSKHADPETYVVLANTECAASCTNPSQACLDKHRELGKKPPCIEAPPVSNLMEPYLSRTGLDHELDKFSEGRSHPLDGTVCIDLRKQTVPIVTHLGRTVVDRCLDVFRQR